MVDMTGKFFNIADLDEDFVKNQVNVAAYEPWAGRYVKNAYDATLTDKDETLDISICIWLKSENKAFRIEKHVHNYPHCWRTDKPVLYYPLDSWFIRSTQAREEMMKLNDTINWQPESTGTGRFGKWLENLNDWNLSRSRYWGTPLPIWRTEDGQEEICIGSIAELMQEIDVWRERSSSKPKLPPMATSPRICMLVTRWVWWLGLADTWAPMAAVG